MLVRKTLGEFIDAVGENTPAPGGGSVSALAGALGAALTAMVCHLTIGKKKYADVQDEMIRVLGEADEIRAKLTVLVDQDTDAFNRVMQAFQLPKDTEEQKAQRSAAIQQATKQATLVPLEVMRLSEQAITLAREVAEKGNVNSISDIGVAGLMLKASCQGAALNVAINLATLQEKEFVEETRTLMQAIETNVEATADRIKDRVEAVLS